MMKIFGLSALFSSLVVCAAMAQHPCGQHAMTQSWLAENPDRIEELRQFEASIPSLEASVASNRVTAIIPVVVHVIHKGEAIGSGTNVSNNRINSQIEILNEDFQRLNTDASQTPSQFVNVAADAGMMFCLANIDPSGNSTTGITRHLYSNIPDQNFIENTIKGNTTWDPNRYLNIWVVDIPEPSFLGYSYLPTSTMVGSVRDGLVVDYLRFGNISSSNRGRTATHELGHYLGLRHVWGNNDSSGNPIGCNSDDGISDTPNCDQPYYGCPNSGSSCSSSDMFMNYMDYTDDDCMNLFTQGQANVMNNILGGIRSELVSGNLTPCSLECKDLEISDLSHGFESSEPNSEWTIVNQNNDDRTWIILEETNADWGPNEGLGMAIYFWNASNAADDYLFSPCIAMESGHEYRIEFSYACAEDVASLYPERFEVGLSSSQSASDFEVPSSSWVFDPITNAYPNYQNASLTYTATTSESKSIGFHIFSDADQYALQIDRIKIEDIGAVSVDNLTKSFQKPIFPNPTKDELNIWRPQDMGSNSTISLMSIDGRVVKSLTPDSNESLVNLSIVDLPAGIYLLKWSDGMHQWVESVVKLKER